MEIELARRWLPMRERRDRRCVVPASLSGLCIVAINLVDARRSASIQDFNALESTNLVCGMTDFRRIDQQHDSHRPSTRMRSTSPPKSAWPGVSTMLIRVSPAVPFDRHAGRLRQNGDAALALLIVGVHCAFYVRLVGSEDARLREHLVDKGRFAVVDVGDDGDIAQGHGYGFAEGSAPVRRVWVTNAIPRGIRVPWRAPTRSAARALHNTRAPRLRRMQSSLQSGREYVYADRLTKTACVMVHCNLNKIHDASLTYLPFLGVSSLMNLAAPPPGRAAFFLDAGPIRAGERGEKTIQVLAQTGISSARR